MRRLGLRNLLLSFLLINILSNVIAVVAAGTNEKLNYRIVSIENQDDDTKIIRLSLVSDDVGQSDYPSALLFKANLGLLNVLKIEISPEKNSINEAPDWLQEFTKPQLGRIQDQIYLPESLYELHFPDVGELFNFAVRQKSSNLWVFNSSSFPFTYSEDSLTVLFEESTDSNVYGLFDKNRMENDNVECLDKSSFDEIIPFYFQIHKEQGISTAVHFDSRKNDLIACFKEKEFSLTFKEDLQARMTFLFGGLPLQVSQALATLKGKPALFPFWSLGYQFDLKETGNSGSFVTSSFSNLTFFHLPFDSFILSSHMHVAEYFNANYLESVHKNIPDENIRIVINVDSGVIKNKDEEAYTSGLKQEIFVKNAKSGKDLEDQDGHGHTIVFPDYLDSGTLGTKGAFSWWQEQLRRLNAMAPLDGVCFQSPVSDMGIDHFYDFAQAALTYKVLQGLAYFNETVANETSTTLQRRPYVVSQSLVLNPNTFFAHSIPVKSDSNTDWKSLRNQISSIINLQLFGVPVTDSGFGNVDDKKEEFFIRKFQIASLAPIMKAPLPGLHQSSSAFVKEIRQTLMLRYRLLSYIYSLYYEAHMFGSPIWYPLFSLYFDDPLAHEFGHQFLLGKSLLAHPITTPMKNNVTVLEVYFPAGCWFDLTTGVSHCSPKGHKKSLKYFGFQSGPLFQLGGSILPLRFPGLNSFDTMLNPFMLQVAFNETESSKGTNSANGDLYMDGNAFDDHDDTDKVFAKLNFKCDLQRHRQYLHCTLSVQENHNYLTDHSMVTLKEMRFFSMKDYKLQRPHMAFINSQPIYASVEDEELGARKSRYVDDNVIRFDPSTKVLSIHNLQVPLTQTISVFLYFLPVASNSSDSSPTSCEPSVLMTTMTTTATVTETTTITNAPSAAPSSCPDSPTITTERTLTSTTTIACPSSTAVVANSSDTHCENESSYRDCEKNYFKVGLSSVLITTVTFLIIGASYYGYIRYKHKEVAPNYIGLFNSEEEADDIEDLQL